MQIKTLRLHFTPERMDHKKKLITGAGGAVGKKEPLFTVGGNADWYNHCRNH